jgi:choline dehydrogenase-like flavoprotein
VDGFLRLHGSSNVFMCDSSIMPRIIDANNAMRSVAGSMLGEDALHHYAARCSHASKCPLCSIFAIGWRLAEILTSG